MNLNLDDLKVESFVTGGPATGMATTKDSRAASECCTNYCESADFTCDVEGGCAPHSDVMSCMDWTIWCATVEVSC